MARCAHFRVAGRFDGATAATVTLADVARGVVYDVTKAELAARRAVRRRGR